MSHLPCRIEAAAALVGGVMMGALGWATLLNFDAVPAQIETSTVSLRNAAPYGGCDEAWQAPRSPGADWCRDREWTVRKQFVLRPSNEVAYLRMDPCREEDSDGPCFWNAERQGNGTGTSFIIKGQRDGKHRIWWVKFR